MVPGEGSNVVIQGTVYVNTINPCYNLTINSSGRITTPVDEIGQVTVSGNLSNSGQIVDGGPSGEVRLVVLGNISNNLSITCEYVYFAGSVSHTFRNYGTFNPVHFIDMGYAQVNFLTDLAMNGTHVNLPILSLNSSVASHVSLSGGFMEHTNIHGGNGASLNLSNGAYLSDVTVDEIVLFGTVLVADVISFSTLINYSNLYNSSADNYGIYVYQRLENHGLIGNNPAGSYLYLYLQGDVENYHTLTPQYLYLGDWNSSTLRYISSSTTLAIPYITTWGNYQLLTNLSFANSTIDWTSHILLMQNGSNSYSLTLSGGSLLGITLDGGTASALNLSNGAWLGGVTADDIIFNGTVLVSDNVNVDRLVNNAALRNTNDNSHVLVVNQRLENHGSIANSSTANFLNINLLGDLYNWGQITNQQFLLFGSATQDLWQSASAGPIACAVLTSYPSNVPIQLLSNLVFSNCQINLGDRPLLLYFGRSVANLSLQGGCLQNAVLQTTGFSTLDISSGAWLEYLDAQSADIILRGTPLIGSDIVFDDLVSYGSLKNSDNSSWSLTCNGNLTNYGTISNFSSSYHLYLYCRKNLSNYGSILNQITYMDGTDDQYVLRGSGSTISCPGGFQLWSDIGAAQWYFNGLPYDTNLYLFLTVNPSLTGIWKPFNSSVFGRNITFGSASGTLSAPQNLSASLNGAYVKLQWNQVPNAVYYRIYTANSPNGTFTALANPAFDNDLSDGLVWSEISPADALKFFRVSAGF